MKGIFRTMALTFAFTLAVGVCGALAMDHSAMGGHTMGAGDSAKEMTAMDHSKHVGAPMHESMLEKAHFAYHLIDNAREMAKAKAEGKSVDQGAMSNMKSNHLMLYPVTLDNKVISGAKVGYMVTGPDKTVQQAMAMEMNGGYGADVDFKAKGKYEIKTKLLKADLQVIDTFTYEVK